MSKDDLLRRAWILYDAWVSLDRCNEGECRAALKWLGEFQSRVLLARKTM